MHIAFTLCSNNYLAHAKTLGDSFLEHHPEFLFCIGLVDKLPAELETGYLSKFTVIPVEELNISDFQGLQAKYTITELNTAVKPSYYHYLFSTYRADSVIYIDPDILVTSRFEEVLSVLQEKNIVITPHLLSPIDDEYAPTDYHTLRGGVFNLGFIALSGYDKVKDFLNWWHDRVIKYGFANFALSMFYDQLWVNYVPAFYDNYHILKHPGYNMANWNLHERYLSEREGTFMVNKNYELRFFHFSSYKYDKPDSICAYLTRYDFTTRPDLKPLFDRYHDLLRKNNIEKIKNLDVFYYPGLQKAKKAVKRTTLQKITHRVYRSLKVLTTGNG